MIPYSNEKDYHCWLNYEHIKDSLILSQYTDYFKNIVINENNHIIDSIKDEIYYSINKILGISPLINDYTDSNKFIVISKIGKNNLVDSYITNEETIAINEEGFLIKTARTQDKKFIIVTSKSDNGLLYGTFYLIRILQKKTPLDNIYVLENPKSPLRMINHWDNLNGNIERGYAGKSIFYNNYELVDNLDRIRDYARLLSSIGINAIVLNNVNVGKEEARLIDDKIYIVETLYDIFKRYGIKVFVSVNFASPIMIGGLKTADPLNEEVNEWWKKRVDFIYDHVPEFGGFLVKADSEDQPGPFSYNRTHADGANMLAKALTPHNGLLIWRSFVYNCYQDWRDQNTDRAKAAYETFMPLDGQFLDNVIIQIKNGPMDFQVREPVNPLFGGLKKTHQILELQITQEYTGQQKHLCYLVPQWKEVLDFDTYLFGNGTTVSKIVSGSPFNSRNFGIAGVANVGDNINWTGHTLAQANLYGYGRLTWNPELESSQITEEWIKCTFGDDLKLFENLSQMLQNSWEIYEKYTSPLGIGWMVNPGHHYGPNVDGYEYSRWGTYHRANHFGIGVDRTLKSGTGFTKLYHHPNFEMFEHLESCPEELLLFFHHVSYIYKLKNNKTLIQHIYDTHFEGVEDVQWLINLWIELEGLIDNKRYQDVLSKLLEQKEHAEEWRDVINTYFYRKTMISDEKGRKIYP
ncbi:alpha-glucuronidase family glycosyl hydrolase [Petrotoga sp. 9PWA.NaAc.5.4]|uniref:alpha-glucuronidase family glycosyl hydrolase n=1 Tax=Petrotoga sp. 9PWA.NaAc.5.4 TaxID=1434328 RepID=UPI000CC74621|nr:alpha-glucuronidase family glycosyl hydrolase [Petrotoga sp. 9PWA.NaAc.5.4]PNR94315.1 alpha-glucuronidase [Petrotoga sp. 9PWA.NaAc.5.4]